MSSYGLYQEQAAGHFLGLLQGPGAAARTGVDRTDLLSLREQVRTALHERLALVGGGHTFDSHVEFRPENAASNGVHLVARVLHATPHDADRQLPDLPPSELLSRACDDVALEQWRHLARALSLGNHQLYEEARFAAHGQGDSRWDSDPSQRWAVLNQTAESVEAFVVLDHQLRRRHLLDQDLLVDGPPAWGPRGDRTVCEAVARQARLQIGSGAPATRAGSALAPDQAADHITSQQPGPGIVPGIVMVQRSFEQLGLAEANLARQLRHLPRSDTEVTQAQLSIRDGRTLLLGQVTLNHQLAGLAETHHPGLRLGFQERARLLLAAVEASRYWVDGTGADDRTSTLHQQQEITLAARRVTTWPVPSPTVLAQLDGAAHRAATGLAWTVRQQVHRGAHFLTRTATEEQDLRQANTAPRHGALYRRLTDLANAPVPYVSPMPAPAARTALRRALADTPTRSSGLRLRPTLPGAADSTITSAPAGTLDGIER